MAEQDKIVHGNFRIKLLPKIKIFLWKKKNEDIDEGYVLIERVDRAFVSRCFSLLRDRASKISPVQGRNGIMRSVRGRNTRCSYSDVGETRDDDDVGSSLRSLPRPPLFPSNGGSFCSQWVVRSSKVPHFSSRIV